jgi:glucose-6-phosphate dehydrogenase assembly protein OpcA
MSTVKKHPGPSWHAEGTTIGEVLNALSDIQYQFARSEAGDDEHLHPRNCVMTLIGIAPTEAHEEVARRTTQTIGMEHPAQAIVIREEAPIRGRHLDAWITTDVQRPETACAIECELITLHVHGQAADHLGALLDPILVSGVPTYLWWLGTPPFGRRELLEALRICDGLVVDSAAFDDPHRSFHRMSSLLKVAHHRLGLADLQWARLRPWRETIAQFFTPADRRAFLDGIGQVRVDYAGVDAANRIAAALLTGWIASALGWKLHRVSAASEGAVVARYESADRRLDVELRPWVKEHMVHGEVCAVALTGTSGGTSFRLTVQHDPERRPGRAGSLHERRGKDTARVLLTMIEIGDSKPLRHVQQLEPADEVSLLLDLLSTGTHDEVYNRSLAAASELIEKM